MNNKEFLEQYVEGYYNKGAHGRMAYKDGRLISYATPICDIDRVLKTAAVNVRKYSSTTSRMQNWLLAMLKERGYTINTYEGSDANYWDVNDSRKVTAEDI